MALIHVGNGEYIKDKGNDDNGIDFLFEYDLICLHDTDNDKSNKPNNVESVESKEIKSNKSDKIESIKSNFITTKSNKLYETALLRI